MLQRLTPSPFHCYCERVVWSQRLRTSVLGSCMRCSHARAQAQPALPDLLQAQYQRTVALQTHQTNNYIQIPDTLSSSLSHHFSLRFIFHVLVNTFKFPISIVLRPSTVFQSRCEDCVSQSLLIYGTELTFIRSFVCSFWYDVWSAGDESWVFVPARQALYTWATLPAQLLRLTSKPTLVHPNLPSRVGGGNDTTLYLWYHPWCDLSQPRMSGTMTFNITSANFNIEGTIFLP